MEDGLKQDKMRVGSMTADYTDASAGQISSVEQNFVSAGSPPTGGNIVLGGDDTLSGGSTWVAYPTTFVSAPKVVVGVTDQAANFDNENTISAGSIDTGSFLAIGSAATTTFNYIAVGSGTF